MKSALSALLPLAILIAFALPHPVMALGDINKDLKSIGGLGMVGALDANHGYQLDQLGAMAGPVLVIGEQEAIEASVLYGKFKVSPRDRVMSIDSTAIKMVVFSELRVGYRLPVWEIFSLPVGIGIARVRETRVQYDLMGYIGVLASVGEGGWHIDLGVSTSWYPDRRGREDEGGKYPPQNRVGTVTIRRDIGQ